MKESHRKDLARHRDPESCGGGRKADGEALTGAHAGRVLSCEITSSGVPTLSTQAEGNTTGGAPGKSLVDPAQSKTLRMRGNSLHGNREIPRAPAADGSAGRLGKVLDHTPGMHAGGKSDDRIVPKKPPNKDTRSAEAVEGRRSTEGNIGQGAAPRTQSRIGASSLLPGVRRAARRDRRARFTALLHHVTIDRLRDSFYALKRRAAPGVDGTTWQQYEVNLEDRLASLHQRIHRGTYRALPSRRVYLPKADGSLRPLGIAALEDKGGQQAGVWGLHQ